MCETFAGDPPPLAGLLVTLVSGVFGALPILEAGRPDDQEQCGNHGRAVQSWRASALERLKQRLRLP